MGAILERQPIERAIPEIMDRVGLGSSNYGRSLATFEAGWLPMLDRRTTVIILGDGRGNRTDPRADVLARIAEHSKQVIWLNPEGRTLWGTGDSDMHRYAPHCRDRRHLRHPRPARTHHRRPAPRRGRLTRYSAAAFRA